MLKKQRFTLLVVLCLSFAGYGQVLQEGCETAVFGVDADVYANGLQFGAGQTNNSNSHDWFFNPLINSGNGVGIIDQSQTNVYLPQLQAENNIAFTVDLAFPQNTLMDGIRIMDGIYARDYYGGNSDLTFFKPGDKNGEDPNVWGCVSHPVTPKTDLIDCYAHFRRDGFTAADHMWMFLGFSRVSNTGDSYFDAELFAKDIDHGPGGFISAGTEEGHTAWSFNQAGAIMSVGDLVISSNFSTTNTPVIELRIWVSRKNYNNTTPQGFTWGPGFDGASNSSLYGYAEVIPNNPQVGCGVSNSGPTPAPPWGTKDGGGDFATSYEKFQLVEYGIDLNEFGIIPEFLTGPDSEPCDNPFANILFKSRSSSSFTATLKDFSGPFQFDDIPFVDVEVQGDSINCYNEIAELMVIDTSLGAYYYWYTDDGNIISNPSGVSSVLVDEEGTYIAVGAIMQECDEERRDTFFVPDYINAFTPTIISDIKYDCTTTTELHAAEDNLIYNWSGPNGFNANTQYITAPGPGIYTLNATDLFTGCDGMANIYVLEYPCQHLIDPGSLPTEVDHTIWLDETVPTFTIPADISIDCNAAPDILVTGDVLDEADCDPFIGEAIFTDASVVSCVGEVIITRTWSLTDGCGNTATGNQIITLEDTTGPTFTIPADITIDCQSSPKPAATGDVTDEADDCDTGFLDAIRSDEISQNDPCNGTTTITRTWSLTDACDNTTTGIQIITLEDNTPPTFTVPADVTIDCNEDANNPVLTGDVVNESDNCSDINLNATYLDVIDTDTPCTGGVIITRTWTLVDGCNNETTGVQIVTMADSTPPTFTIPDDLTIECNQNSEDLGLTGDVTDEADDCDTSIGEAIYSDTVQENTPCTNSSIISRTWTLTDNCGNTATNVQVITVVDSTPPTFTVPPTITIQCDQDENDLDLTGDVTDEGDLCDNSGIYATYVDLVVEDNPCIGTKNVARTWTLTDACDNVTSYLQIIMMEDTTPPQFTTPADITIECEQDENDLTIVGDLSDVTDNCDDTTIATSYTDVVTNNTPCLGASSIVRTWKAVDDCGNTTTAIQNIALDDSTPPTFTVPEDVSIECDLNENDLTLTGDVTDEADNCDNSNLDASYTDDVSPNDPCMGAKVITRTWSLADACGNITTAIQIVTLEDTTPPVFSEPTDVTIDCNVDETDLFITGDVIDESDNCDPNIGEAAYTDVVSEENPCVGSSIITRTWRLTDICGNETTAEQIITVEDTTPPVFTLPADATIECHFDVLDPNLVGEVLDEFDNCDISLGEATYIETVQNANPCNGSSILTRIWNLSDDCGNVTSGIQTITLEDTTPPIFSTPEDLTISCDADETDLTITGDVLDESDFCDTNLGEATYIDAVSTDDPCIGAQVVTRTWSLSDACGNLTTGVQTITMEDTTPPTFGVPVDVTIECDLDETDLTITGDVLDEADNCDTSLGEAIYTDVISADDPCIGAMVIERTWSLTDACGNVTIALQVVTIEDTTPPTFTVPEDVTLECEIDESDLTITGEVLDEADNCDTSIGEATFIDVVSTDDPCIGARIVTRTWSLTDACGNETTAIQTITLEDTTPPTFTLPEDVTMDCHLDILDPTIVGEVLDEADNCDTTLGEATYVETIQDADPCIGAAVITRNWSLSDACGNMTTGIQTITLIDTIPPEFTVPEDITIECDQDPSDLTIVGDVLDESDLCDSTLGEASYTDVVSADDPCVGASVITRTWSLTDACGNEKKAAQIITLEDTTPPTFGVPVDVTIECDLDKTDLTNTGDVLDEADNCDTSLGEATYTDVISADDPCIGAMVIERTWSLTDACGNVTTELQVVTIEDTTPPTFTVPEDVTLECENDESDLTITGEVLDEADNCDTSLGEATFTDVVSVDDPCIGARIVTRTWSLTDACGNETTEIQTITLEDTTPPTFTLPEDVTMDCHLDILDPTLIGEVLDEADNCDTTLGEATYVETIQDADPCIGAAVITRNWSLSDACGNMTTGIQTITLIDTIPPEFTVPEDITIECDQDPSDLTIVGDVLDESDLCDSTLGEASYTDVVSADDPCVGASVITRTWSLTDACGNEKKAAQIITLEDTTPPTFGVPVDVTIECDLDETDLTITGDVLDEADNCDTSLGEAIYTDVISADDPCIGAMVIERTWSLTDACGNVITGLQVVTIEDTTPPTFTVPEDVTLECEIDESDLTITGEVLDEADNCDTSIGEATFIDVVSTDDPCIGARIVTRTWSLTDACGNETTAIQTITLEDTTPPTFTIPEDVTMDCHLDTSDPTIVGEVLDEADNCDTTLGEAGFIETIQNANPCIGASIITRIWNLSDDCGNVTSGIQTITLIDTIPPLFTAPEDITISCDEDPSDLGIVGDVLDESDLCDTSLGEASYSDEISPNEPCEGASIITRTWSLADACGNVTTAIQIITQEDIVSPVFSELPDDVTTDCDNIPVPVAMSATDICIGDLTPTYSEVRVDGDCIEHYTLVRTWEVADSCGNTNSHVQNISVVGCSPKVVITVSPVATICQDELVTFSSTVGAAYPTPVYQWQFSVDGVIWNDIVGETNATLSFVTDGETDGWFRVVVSNSSDDITNTDCNVLSNELRLDVLLNVEDTQLYENLCPGLTTIFAGDTLDIPGIYVDSLVGFNGCDSVVFLDLQFLDLIIDPVTLEICDGDSVIVGNSVYDIPGNYADTLVGSDGCFILQETALIVHPNLFNPIEDEICDGETVSVGTSTYDATGTYIDTLQTSHGCDSIVELTLTVHAVFADTIVISFCDGDSISVGGNIYTTTGFYTENLNTQFDCDSIVYLDLTVFPVYNHEQDIHLCFGDSIDVGNSTYYTDGIYFNTFTTINGCDSIMQTTVAVSNEVYGPVDDVWMCAGQTHTNNWGTFDSTGIYFDTLMTAQGCDSILTLQLVELDSILNEINEVICDGETFDIGTQTLTTTGTYLEIFTADNLCDSIVTLNLLVNPNTDTLINHVDCWGTTFSAGGQTFVESGSYTINLLNQYDCDSTIVLELIIRDSIFMDLDSTICEGDTLFYDNNAYTTTGVYDHVFTSFEDCDSTVRYVLTVLENSVETIKQLSCDGTVFSAGGQNFTETGNYTINIPNAVGCDSTITLNIEFIDSVFTQITEVLCDGEFYPYEGVDYTTSGTHVFPYTTPLGCDSIVTLELLFNPNTDTLINHVDCWGTTFTAGGETFDESGSYTINTLNQYNCDSTIVLNLTIRDSIYTNLDSIICEGDTIFFDTLTYTTTGRYEFMYTSVYGCDSLVAFDLTVHPNTVEVMDESRCDGTIFTAGGQDFTETGNYTINIPNYLGCDSTILLNIEFIDSVFSTLNIGFCAGESASYNGIVYSVPGVFDHAFISAAGCDSIVTVTVDTLTHTTLTVDTSTCYGTPYTIGGETFTETGAYTINLDNTNGCDSTIYLDIFFIDTVYTNLTEIICENDTAFYNGINYSNPGIYQHTFISSFGCDSIVNYEVIQNRHTDTTIIAEACYNLSVIVGGQVFDSTGIYTINLDNALECDSTIYLELTILDSIYNNTNEIICQGESYTFNSVTYESTGVYLDTLIASNGCDSFDYLYLVELPEIDSTLYRSACKGTIVNVAGESFTETGSYQIDLTSSFGCDSTLYVNIDFIDTIFTEFAAEFCEGDDYTYNGVTYTTPGTHQHAFVSEAGCDSIVTLILDENPDVDTLLTRVGCDGVSFEVAGEIFTEDGIYTINLLNQNGCDSTITVEVTMIDTIFTPFFETICEGETFNFQGVDYNSAGVYEFPYTSAIGCDSLVVLTIHQNTHTDTILNIVDCYESSFVIDGQVYDSTGNYNVVIPNYFGCDSLITLNLLLNDSISSMIVETICEGETVIFGGNPYTTPGIFVDIFTAANGCDSTAYLDLTVNPLSELYLTESTCTGATFTVGGQDFSTSGNYQIDLLNHYGCDSIIYLDITFVDSISSIHNAVFCEGDSFDYENDTYTDAGTYQHVLVTSEGCDSIVTLVLSMVPDVDTLVYATACYGIDFEMAGQTYTESGTYTIDLTNQNGCDSTVTLEITFIDTIFTIINEVFCEGDSFPYVDSIFYAPGSYEYGFTSSLGCDSIVTLELEMLLDTDTIIERQVCIGSTYTFNGETFDSTGIYQIDLFNSNGCDSTIQLDVIFVDTVYTALASTFCEGDEYEFGDSIYTTGGVHLYPYLTENGCDSIILLTLNMLPDSDTTIYHETCYATPFTIAGETFEEAGSYTIDLLNENNCDSTIYLNLIFRDSSFSDMVHEMCEGDTINFNGVDYTQTGNYGHNYVNQFGCDSTANLILTVYPHTAEYVSQVSCYDTPFTIAGQTFTTDGIYTIDLTNQYGCDSTLTVAVQFRDSIYTNINESICEGETASWNGANFNTTGVYTQTYTSYFGCDSLVNFVLDVVENSDTIINQVNCYNTTYTIGEQVFDETGIYNVVLNNAAGCDSLIQLILTINQPIETELYVGFCDGDSYTYDGTNYDAAGTYMHEYTSTNGCDSTVYLNVVVHDIYEMIEEMTICVGDSVTINGQVIFTSGIYTDSLTTYTGCDSLIIVDLTVEDITTLTPQDYTICEGESVQLYVDGSETMYWSPPTSLSCTNCPDPIATPIVTTTYNIIAESCLGEMVETTVTVFVNELPEIQVDADIYISHGDTATIIASVNKDDVELIWTDQTESVLCIDCVEMDVVPTNNSVYTITAIDLQGCQDEVDVNIKVNKECTEGIIEVPNFITPNGDGANDFMEVRYSKVKRVALLRVYNRWGELLFHTEEVNSEFWDGTFKGRPLNPGVYVYYMDIICLNGDPFVKTGNITIIN